jgi:hypothetical protein
MTHLATERAFRGREDPGTHPEDTKRYQDEGFSVDHKTVTMGA